MAVQMDRAAIRTRPGTISVQSPVLGTAHALLGWHTFLPASWGKRESYAASCFLPGARNDAVTGCANGSHKERMSSSSAQRTGTRGSELAQRGAQVVEETIEVR